MYHEHHNSEKSYGMHKSNQNSNRIKWKEVRIIHNCIIGGSAGRKGSFENALLRLSSSHVTRGIFVQTLIGEFMFDRKMRMEEHIGKFYDCFPLEDDKKGADWRYILCTYLCIVLSDFVLENPIRILFKLFDVFSNSHKGILSIQNAMKIISIAAISNEDYEQTSNRMYTTIKEMSYMQTNSISKDRFKNVLDVSPGILLSFRDQLFQQVGKAKRLQLLTRQEKKAADSFERHSRKIKLERIVFVWKYHSQLRFFCLWKEYKNYKIFEKRNQLWMLYWKAQRKLQYWHTKTQRIIEYKRLLNRVEIMGKINTMRRFLRLWKKYNHVVCKIRSACDHMDETYKKMSAGIGHLRIMWNYYKVRIYMRKWFIYMFDGKQWDKALDFCQMGLKKKCFRVLRKEAKLEIQRRKLERDADSQQRWLFDTFNAMDAQLMDMMKQMEESRRFDEDQKRKEYNYNIEMRMQREKAEKKTKERYIKEVQQEARRSRVLSQTTDLIASFEKEWRTKFVLMENETNRKTDVFLKRAESKEFLLKELKNLKKDFFMLPSSENEKREKMLSSIPNICMSIIDGKLFHKNVLINEFVDKLEKIESENGAITYDDLCYTITEYQIEVDTSLKTSLFEEINIHSSRNDQVLPMTEKLMICLRNSQLYNGVQGSPWKKYVSPAHQILLYHNVVEDVKIFDYDITNKKLQEIVHSNIRAKNLLKSRILFKNEKKKNYLIIIETNAAKTIQNMFRARKQRKYTNNQIWKLRFRKIRIK